jgi:signal transduction histidine kinase
MSRVYQSLVEQHETGLVLLAALVCFLACYTAFSLVVRPNGTEWNRTPWLIAAAVVTGCGAWAAHAIQLLAFRPEIAASYDPLLTVLSGVVAIAGCGLGFHVARTTDRMALGGAIIGAAIAAMHYLGMAGVDFAARESWDITYVQISVVLVLSFAAASRPRAELMPDVKGRLISASLLTAGICGLHFVGMAGLTLTPEAAAVQTADGTGTLWFAIALTAVIILIVGLGVAGSLVDQHLSELYAAKRDLEETTARLSKALQLADAGSASKSQFLSIMSHELRTPLNAIIGFSEIIKGELFGPLGNSRYHEYVADICRCGTHLLSVINDILDTSKFDAGRLELHEEPVDLRELIEQVVKLMALQAQTAQVKLSVNFPTDDNVLQADSKRMRQILLNLLSNAVKFTPEGGTVSVCAGRRDGAYVIAVSDTGIGMASEQIPKALERFGQIDSSLSRRHEGTGLGLPLTKCLVELHGGTLTIDSTVNKGTTVIASLPESRILPNASETLAVA